MLSPEMKAGTPLWDRDSEERKYLQDVLSTLDSIIHHADNNEEILAAYDFYSVRASALFSARDAAC
jgi:hypothetical protein